MQRKSAIPSLSSIIDYLYQRLLSKQYTGFSRHDTGRSETDDLLERMSLRELGDLPLGPEPRFMDCRDLHTLCSGRIPGGGA
jgi:hypothetical protein